MNTISNFTNMEEKMKMDIKAWKNMPTTALITITPELAKQMLERNYELNRVLNWNDISTIAADILNGNWRVMRNQPIVFTKNGVLLDGQHRLHAVVLANKSVSAWIHCDASMDDFYYMDGGSSRKAQDFIKDLPYRKELVSLTRSIIVVESGGLLRSAMGNLKANKETGVSGRASRTMIRNYINENSSELITCIEYAQKIVAQLYGKGSKKETSMFIWVVRKVGRDDKIDEFIESFKFENKSQNADVYQKWLMSLYGGGKIPARGEQLKKLFESYEDFRSNRTKTKFGRNSDKYLNEYDALLSAMREGKEQDNA